MTTSLTDQINSKVQEGQRHNLLESVLRSLNEQKKLFEDYNKEVERQSKAYASAERSYQHLRQIYNRNGKSNENYKGHAHDGDTFETSSMTLGSLFLGMSTKHKKPRKQDYEVRRDYHLRLKDMIEQETWMLSRIGHAYGAKKDDAADWLYRDVPALITPEIQPNIYGMQKAFPTRVDQWEPKYMEIGAASVAVKMANPALIDRQIRHIQKMIKTAEPWTHVSLGRRMKNALNCLTSGKR